MPRAASGERPRRERVGEQERQQTIEEIRRTAFALLDAEGVTAVSPAAVGRAMGMTRPALHRYFPSRDALVDALVVAAHADLGVAVAAAATTAPRGGTVPKGARVALLAREYRRWALAHPRRYMVLFTDRSPDAQDPVDGAAAVNRGMLALIAALAEIAAPAATTTLDRALLRWGQSIGAPADTPPAVLGSAVQLWSRIHGLVTLEIAGAFDSMGVDAGLLLDVEVGTALDAVTGG